MHFWMNFKMNFWRNPWRGQGELLEEPMGKSPEESQQFFTGKKTIERIPRRNSYLLKTIYQRYHKRNL